MSYEFERFAAQGWQCPICRRVYAPDTPMCFYCGNETTTTTTELTFTMPQDYSSFIKTKKNKKGVENVNDI